MSKTAAARPCTGLSTRRRCSAASSVRACHPRADVASASLTPRPNASPRMATCRDHSFRVDVHRRHYSIYPHYMFPINHRHRVIGYSAINSASKTKPRPFAESAEPRMRWSESLTLRLQQRYSPPRVGCHPEFCRCTKSTLLLDTHQRYYDDQQA